MFGFGPATRICLAVGATDMRKGFEGLFGLVRDRLQCSPTSGHVFLFCNRQRNRLKLLVFDGSGLWVCAKRLERGRFSWPQAGDAQSKVTLSHEELTLLVGGIDLSQTQRKRYLKDVTDLLSPLTVAARAFAESAYGSEATAIETDVGELESLRRHQFDPSYYVSIAGFALLTIYPPIVLIRHTITTCFAMMSAQPGPAS